MDAQAVVIGAGRIGRGYMAEVLQSAGYKMAFVDKDSMLVQTLEQQKRYTVHKAWDDGHWDEVTISGYEVALPEDESYEQWLMRPELVIGIAVFKKDLPDVFSVLGPLLCKRMEAMPDKPVNCLYCVNMIHPASYGWECLRAAVPTQYYSRLEDYVGMADCIVNTTAPGTPVHLLEKDALALINNGFEYMTLDARSLKAPLREGALLYFSQRIGAEEMRKIHTVNTAHVTLGYLGIPMGYKMAHEAVGDGELRQLVEQALAESAVGLCGEYGFSKEEMEEWNAHVVLGMGNPALGDELARLCADSGRKLYKSDRMVGPALNCVKHGGEPIALIKVILAAMRYEYGGDLGSQRVRHLWEREGTRAVLEQICTLSGEGVEGRLCEMILAAEEA